MRLHYGRDLGKSIRLALREDRNFGKQKPRQACDRLGGVASREGRSKALRTLAREQHTEYGVGRPRRQRISPIAAMMPALTAANCSCVSVLSE